METRLQKTGLKEELVREIVGTILRFVTPEKIVLYGSRARGDHTRGSDIDLAILAPNLSLATLARIRDALENEVRTLLRFDVGDFYRIQDPELRKHILKEGVVLYESRTG